MHLRLTGLALRRESAAERSGVRPTATPSAGDAGATAKLHIPKRHNVHRTDSAPGAFLRMLMSCVVD